MSKNRIEKIAKTDNGGAVVGLVVVDSGQQPPAGIQLSKETPRISIIIFQFY